MTQADQLRYTTQRLAEKMGTAITKEVKDLLVEHLPNIIDESVNWFMAPVENQKEVLRDDDPSHEEVHEEVIDPEMFDQIFKERVENLLKTLTFEGQQLYPMNNGNATWKLILESDQLYGERLYIQVGHWRQDATMYKGSYSWGTSRKQYLSPFMTDSEIYRQVFALFDGYQHHETREAFKVNGRAVFGPHIDVEALWEVANNLDVRKG